MLCNRAVNPSPTVTCEAAVESVIVPSEATTCGSITLPSARPVTVAPTRCHSPVTVVTGAVERFWQDTESRWMLLRGDKARPLVPPTELFLPPDQFNGALKTFARIEFARTGKGPTAPVPPVQVDRRAADPLAALKRFLELSEQSNAARTAALRKVQQPTPHRLFGGCSESGTELQVGDVR